MSDDRIIPPGQVLRPMDAEPRSHRRSAAKAGTRKRETADRFALLNAFVDCSIGELSRSELGTWLVLYRDTRKGTARTSAEDIGRRIGTSKRGVIDALAKLQKRGLLTRVFKGGLNLGPSTYRVYPLPREPG